MNRDDWEQTLKAIGSDADRALLRRLEREDPDMADALRAKLIEQQLDDIGLQSVSPELHAKLYAIADNNAASPSVRPWFNKKGLNRQLLNKQALNKWLSPGLAIAASLAFILFSDPWPNDQPTDEEIALARQQLAVAFAYLHKTADKTRYKTRQSITHGIGMAMEQAVFLEPETIIEPKEESTNL